MSGVDGLDPAVRMEYERVPWLERKASGWLILRVLNRNPRRARELERYGPKGAVGLARMRAFQGWGYPVFVLTAVVAVALGPGDAFWVFLILFALCVGIFITGLGAAREGRRWRADHEID